MSQATAAPTARDSAAVAIVSVFTCMGNLLFLSGHSLFEYPVIDAAWHHQWAGMVSGGDLLAYAPFFRAPLYPWLLGLWYTFTGNGAFSGALLSVLLTAAGALILHRCALRMMPRWWALGSGLIWALWGSSVFYSSQLLITPLFILLLLSSFLLLTGEKRRTAGWFLLGLACIARPTALLLIPAAWFAAGRPGFRGWLAMGLPIAAVWIVNILAGDPGTVISSQGGVNLFIGNSHSSDGYTAFVPSVDNASPEWSFGSDRPYIDNVELASRMAYPEISRGSEVSSEWTGRAISEAFDDPLHWFGLLGKKFIYLLSPVEIPSNYDPYYYRGLSSVISILLHPPPAALPMLLLWLLLPGALLRGESTRQAKAAGYFALTIAAGLLLFFVTSRMRLPLVPFSLLWLISRVSARPGKALILAPAGAAVGIALGLVTSSTILSGGVNMPFHNALAHYSEGEMGRAEDLFVMALERASIRDDIDLNGTEAMYNLGLMAMGRGDTEEAVFWWTAALERNPSHSPSISALETLGSLDPNTGVE